MSTTTTTHEARREADVVAVTQVIDDTEAAFNAGDADLLAAQFAEDGWSVGVNGQLLVGRERIAEVGRELFAGPLRGQRARYEIDDLRFVAPDVVVVRKHAWASDDDGNDIDVNHAMTALYVLVREGGGWRVAARQNTLVPR